MATVQLWAYVRVAMNSVVRLTSFAVVITILVAPACTDGNWWDGTSESASDAFPESACGKFIAEQNRGLATIEDERRRERATEEIQGREEIFRRLLAKQSTRASALQNCERLLTR